MTRMDICLYENKIINPAMYLKYRRLNTEMKYAYIEYCEYDCLSLQEIHQKCCMEMTNIIKMIYDEKRLSINPKIDIKSACTLERDFLSNSIIGGISHVHKKGKYNFTADNNGCVIDVVSLYVFFNDSATIS